MHLAEARLQEPQRDRSVVAVLLDEVHDFQAVIWASGSHSQPMRPPHEINDFFLGRIKLEDVAALRDRLEGIVPLGDHIAAEDETALEDERARQVIQLAGPIGHDARIAPESRPQQAEVRHGAEDAVHIVEEDDPAQTGCDRGWRTGRAA